MSSSSSATACTWASSVPTATRWIETPNLDRLAAEGVVFDHHFPENLTTLPTRRSWWTGRYGFADPEQGWTPLRPDEPILPDLLWNQGVRTALISDVPLLREAGRGSAAGSTRCIWVRGQGYDPLVPPGDPRAAKVRLEDEPGLRLPPEDDPDHDLWKARWEQFLRNRAVLRTDVEENTGRRADRPARRSTGSSGAGDATRPVPALARPVQPARAVGPAPALPRPVRHRRARRVRGRRGRGPRRGRGRGRRDRPRGGPRPDRRPGRRRRRRARRGRAAPAPADLRRDGHAGRPLARRALRRPEAAWAGWTTPCVVFTSDQGEPLGEHGYVRRFRPWLYEELIHTPLIVRMPGGQHGGIRHQALVQTVDLLPTILSALGLPPSDDAVHGHDLLPLIRGEQTKVRDYACLGMDVEEFAIRTHLWHLIVPVEPDPDEPPVPRALPQARGPLGPEQRHRPASRGGRAPRANAPSVRRGDRPRRARLLAHAPRRCAVLRTAEEAGVALPLATASRIRCQTRGRTVGRQGRQTGQTSRFFGIDVGAEPPA